MDFIFVGDKTLVVKKIAAWQVDKPSILLVWMDGQQHPFRFFHASQKECDAALVAMEVAIQDLED